MGRTSSSAVKSFCINAKELQAVTAVDTEYVILAADEALGHQVFRPETKLAYEKWLEVWREEKSIGDSFSIQLGGQNLEFSATRFLESTEALAAMIRLGEALAEAYVSAQGKRRIF
jgi:hypothetical protein